MARPTSEIYNQIITEKNKRLELNEIKNDSKMGIYSTWAWVTAGVIHAFESIMDAFVIDVNEVISNRINGTPQFYVNAALKFQLGDSLTVREDGMAFGYQNIDESKRIITQAAYQESPVEGNIDSKLLIKVATGSKGELQPLTEEQLVNVRAYFDKIKFAGTNVEVISRKGDVLVPRLTVYHDGILTEDIILTNVGNAIHEFIMETSFNSTLSVSKLMDRIRSIEHISDVYSDPDTIPEQGVYLTCYGASGQQEATTKVNRIAYMLSGYTRESSKVGDESELPTFREAIVLKVDRL